MASAPALERSPAKPSEVSLGKRRATSSPLQNDPDSDVIVISDDDHDAMPMNKSRKSVPKSGNIPAEDQAGTSQVGNP